MIARPDRVLADVEPGLLGVRSDPSSHVLTLVSRYGIDLALEVARGRRRTVRSRHAIRYWQDVVGRLRDAIDLGL